MRLAMDSVCLQYINFFAADISYILFCLQMKKVKMIICIAEIILAACIGFIAGTLTTKFAIYSLSFNLVLFHFFLTPRSWSVVPCIR